MCIELKDDYDFWALYDCCNKQGKDVMDCISNNNKEDELIQLLEDIGFNYLISVTDYIQYEWQEIYKELEIEED